MKMNPDAVHTWKKSIAKLQSFSEGKDIGRSLGNDGSNSNRLERSYWPDTFLWSI
ncbi:hypothetical protein SAMN05216302_101850 [Nitrosomonas aestuarii]|uniref:Uncharacterized protein n=1 Tax=Nitrosomonas aestuarii TaxID=52441 RepID=A0A1I4D1A6_9PROT|nr:hypothetical protein SAMN05216302_101850 [Nitrosomonas aestuarii]